MAPKTGSKKRANSERTKATVPPKRPKTSRAKEAAKTTPTSRKNVQKSSKQTTKKRQVSPKPAAARKRKKTPKLGNVYVWMTREEASNPNRVKEILKNTGVPSNTVLKSNTKKRAKSTVVSEAATTSTTTNKKAGRKNARKVIASKASTSTTKARKAVAKKEPAKNVPKKTPAKKAAAKSKQKRGIWVGEDPKRRDAIHQLLKAHGIKQGQLSKLSRCVMAGIDRGFVKLLPPEKDPKGKFGLNQVIATDNCLVCDKAVTCCLKDVLFQPDYGGNDYEEGGPNATLHCPDKECIGLFVSFICAGDPSIGCGKFHNHCEVCPDFGECLGDYREGHCLKCGGHYHGAAFGAPCYVCHPESLNF